MTVGTWILNFVAAVHGGIWDRAASYTPTAMVAELQHGLVRLDAVLVAAHADRRRVLSRRHLDASRRCRVRRRVAEIARGVAVVAGG